jgi:hypothetical protein
MITAFWSNWNLFAKSSAWFRIRRAATVDAYAFCVLALGSIHYSIRF